MPHSTLSALRAAPRQLVAELPLAAAIHWYQQARMSMERAAECAGLTRAAFLAELARRKVDVFVVDEDDLLDELRNGCEEVQRPFVLATHDGGLALAARAFGIEVLGARAAHAFRTAVV